MLRSSTWTDLRTLVLRPALWGAAYLALIPAFGLWYSRMPTGSFFDSNLTREKAVGTDRVEILDRLTESLREGIDERNWRGGDGFRHRYIPGRISITSFKRTKGGLLRLHVTGDTAVYAPQLILLEPGGKQPSRRQSTGTSPFGVSVEINLAAGANVDVDGESLQLYQVLPTSHKLTKDLFTNGHWLRSPFAYLFRREVPTVAPDALRGFGPRLGLEDALVDSINRNFQTPTGDPKSASEMFLRMTYFSVVTATTLGFGDITPVSTDARTAVTIEAVLGVVLVGLFLNALARGRPWQSRSTPENSPSDNQLSLLSDADRDP